MPGFGTERSALAAVGILGVLTLFGCAKKTGMTDVTSDDKSTRNSSSNSESGAGSEAVRAGESGVRNLNNVFFRFDDSSLSGEARSALSENATQLKENQNLKVLIEGHCDERGTVEYNLALGQRRADAARQYLMSLGIDPDRLATVSYGKERPFSEGHDESAWAQNRRAHFKSRD